MPVSPDVMGPATLTLGQSLSMFQVFMPKFTDIGQHTPGSDPNFEKDVRMAEVAASLVTLGIGAVTSSLSGSPVPSIVSVVCIVGLITLYESALRSPGNTGGAANA